jgi:hypothetical protein
MTGIVTSTLYKIDPNSANNFFINQGKNNGRDIPMVEVRFNANDIFAKLKGGEDFGRMHIANSAYLATLVRGYILKGIHMNG